jgi:phage tail sheath protein FI
VYHPWIVFRDDGRNDELTRLPPDGVTSGMLAERALTRGAWIAPANERLRGVVALTPPLSRGRYLALQDAQVNVVRHEPRGFMSLSADTLSEDADLVPINVRRLLILLRRLALREGATYVFEPNGDGFRRHVQRSFEALLGQLFARGAFAGASPATAFQVVTGETVNTARSIDQGRVIVELRVAPSLPLTFLTVRLVQSGDRRLLAEER